MDFVVKNSDFASPIDTIFVDMTIVQKVSNSFLLRLAVFSAIAFAIYGFSLTNEFVMDDEIQIQGNAITESLSNLGRIFKGNAMDGHGGSQSYGVYFRPLMITSFTLLRSAFGLQTLPFHLFQLLLHIANALLLFVIYRRFVSPSIALLGAVFFLVHPMNVEAVSYIASVQDPLFAFFGLVGLWLTIKWESFNWARALGISALFFLSILGKETGALLIFSAGLYCLMFSREKIFKVVAAGSLAVVAYLALRVGLAGLVSMEHTDTQLARAPLSVKLLTLPMILMSYLGKFIVPINLATTQDWVVASAESWEFWLPLVAVLAALVLVLVYIVRKKQDRSQKQYFIYFGLWTLAGFVLHSHLIAPLDGTVAERWFYFPCMGLVGMSLTFIAQSFLAMQKRFGASMLLQRGVLGLVTIIILIYSVQSYTRSQVWRDGYALYSTDVVTNPDSAHLQNNLGVELFRRGQYADAKSRFEKSIQLNPYWKISWNNLGAVYQRTGDLKRAEEAYVTSTKYGPYLLTHQNLLAIFVRQGRLSEARDYVEKVALPQFPNDPVLLDMKRQLSGSSH